MRAQQYCIFQNICFWSIIISPILNICLVAILLFRYFNIILIINICNNKSNSNFQVQLSQNGLKILNKYSIKFIILQYLNFTSTPIMRKKAPSQKLPCAKENCCGVSNQHENFLSVTSRGQTRSHSKKKIKRTKKKENSNSAMKQIIQETYAKLREQNQQLHKKLALKKKKIDEMRIRINEFEEEVKRYREMEKRWIQSQESKHQKKKSKEGDDKNYVKIVQDSHSVAKETLQRYKKLQDEYSKYRQSMQKKMDKLRSQKQRLITESADTAYNKQIQELKHELSRFRQQQITATSLKNLHSNSSSQEERLRLEITTLKATISTLKSQNGELTHMVKQLQEELEERTYSAHGKEKELKNNLDIITSKINGWEREYELLKQECYKWEQLYHSLEQKYNRKKNKYRMNNAEWAEIFKQFIYQIDKLKQELDSVSERNVKLIKMYGHH